MIRVSQDEHRVNFIDENDVFVGYCNYTSCCEKFWWDIFDHKPRREYISSHPETYPEDDIEGYVFDTNFFVEDSADEYTNFVVFRMVAKGKPNKYLVLANSHNGYYAHGFTASIGDRHWQSGSL